MPNGDVELEVARNIEGRADHPLPFRIVRERRIVDADRIRAARLEAQILVERAEARPKLPRVRDTPSAPRLDAGRGAFDAVIDLHGYRRAASQPVRVVLTGRHREAQPFERACAIAQLYDVGGLGFEVRSADDQERR